MDDIDGIWKRPLLGDDYESVYQVTQEWEDEAGLKGSMIWACFDEFLECEFLDKDFMKELLPADAWKAYNNLK